MTSPQRYAAAFLLSLALALACLVYGRHLHSGALHCARTLAAPTDQHIADCYTSRGLPCPDDICPTYGDNTP